MKNLRKSIAFILVALLLGAVSLTSCNDADFTAEKKLLTGSKWKLIGFETDAEYFADLFELMFQLFDVTYEFKKNGEYVVTTKFLFAVDTEEGTWSMSDDGKTITIDDEVSTIKEITKTDFVIGANKKIMGDYADDSQEDELEGFDDYSIVFKAK
jgi:ABC-type oligopeptide transport system substrate-binding subunit